MKIFFTANNRNWKTSVGVLAILTLAGSFAPCSFASPVPDESLWIRVKAGDRSEDVRTLQYLLKARGYKVGADGIFSTQTKNAVTKFQKSKGMKVDGLAGPKTWKALVGKVQLGSKGDVVRAVQNALKVMGYGDGLSVDGNFGKQTQTAVKKYQKEYSIKSDGIVGNETWASLLVDETGD